MGNFIKLTEKSYAVLNNELFRLQWLLNTAYIWNHNQGTQTYTHVSGFVFYSSKCARGKSYRTDGCQQPGEWSLALANSVHPLQFTLHKAGSATQLQRSLSVFTLKLLLPWRFLGDFRGAVVSHGCYAKTGFQLLDRNRTFQHALGVFILLRYFPCR